MAEHLYANPMLESRRAVVQILGQLPTGFENGYRDLGEYTNELASRYSEPAARTAVYEIMARGIARVEQGRTLHFVAPPDDPNIYNPAVV